MKVSMVVVGKARGEIGSAISDYEARTRHYWKLEVVEVDGGAGGSDDRERVVRAEGERLLARLPEGAEVIALTRGGRGWSSRDLARYLGDRALHGVGDVAFVIGGAWGLDPEVTRRAARTMSLSPLTLPHEMARLILTEQLYRAGTILRGEPYHKGRG